MRFGFIKTGASAEYDEDFMEAMASEYERMTPWTRMRLENVRLLVDPQPGDRVLDIGSAAGAIVHYLSTFGCDPVGVDLSELGVEKARERFPGLRFEVGDACRSRTRASTRSLRPTSPSISTTRRCAGCWSNRVACSFPAGHCRSTRRIPCT
jgi:hypothetical protein